MEEMIRTLLDSGRGSHSVQRASLDVESDQSAVEGDRRREDREGQRALSIESQDLDWLKLIIDLNCFLCDLNVLQHL